MRISQNVKEGLILVALVGLGLWLLLPRGKKGIKSPKVAEDSHLKNMDNAKIVLDAYLNAMEAGESKTELQKLNSIFASEYGLKVLRTQNGKYTARTLDGKDILMTK
jgi:hypothetical protein